jgi:TonB family protein
VYAALRGATSTTLLWAFAASLAAHSLFLTFPVRDRNSGIGAAGPRGGSLQATLVPLPAIEPAPAPQALNASVLATPSTVPPPTAQPSVAPVSVATSESAVGKAADVEVESEPLKERAMLGDFLAREQSEFPIEIDVPPTIDGKIVAVYPRTARAAGREGMVAVWVVVDQHGAPEEVQIVEGDLEFADAVVQAVSAAHFRPARNNLVPIRFPISLEFRFALNAAATVVEASATR